MMMCTTLGPRETTEKKTEKRTETVSFFIYWSSRVKNQVLYIIEKVLNIEDAPDK